MLLLRAFTTRDFKNYQSVPLPWNKDSQQLLAISQIEKKLSVAACHLQLRFEGDKDLLKLRDLDINSVCEKLFRFQNES